MTVLLMLGSAPMALQARAWPKQDFDAILAINNAHSIRADWDHAIYPWDFPAERHPSPAAGQNIVTEAEFVPAQNAYGGFLYAGATMAFTAAYWALDALTPRVIAAFGCDMHYPANTATHFYGAGTADPLRPDITLQSLEAKSARLMLLAAAQGCAMVNLSEGPTRLCFPRATRAALAQARPLAFDQTAVAAALQREADLGYTCPSGRYWEELHRFDPAELAKVDQLWLQALAQSGVSLVPQDAGV